MLWIHIGGTGGTKQGLVRSVTPATCGSPPDDEGSGPQLRHRGCRRRRDVHYVEGRGSLTENAAHLSKYYNDHVNQSGCHNYDAIHCLRPISSAAAQATMMISPTLATHTRARTHTMGGQRCIGVVWLGTCAGRDNNADRPDFQSAKFVS